MQYKNIKKQVVKNPKQLWRILSEILKMEDKGDRRKEHFWGIGLNSNNRIEYVELISLGILDQTIVHPREVFRLAVLKNVDHLIVAHNHPSNKLIPSDDDIEITKRLVIVAQYIGISLIDHLIISDKGYLSLHQKHKPLFQYNAAKLMKNAAKLLEGG